MAHERKGEMMTITAKYGGTCRKCGGTISVGGKIEWEKGKVAYIDLEKCTKCTSCYDACRFMAID